MCRRLPGPWCGAVRCYDRVLFETKLWTTLAVLTAALATTLHRQARTAAAAAAAIETARSERSEASVGCECECVYSVARRAIIFLVFWRQA